MQIMLYVILDFIIYIIKYLINDKKNEIIVKNDIVKFEKKNILKRKINIVYVYQLLMKEKK